MKKKSILFLLIVNIIYSFAQSIPTNDSISIFQTLKKADPITGAKVVVIQDQRIDSLFSVRKLHAANSTMMGYRVQVFSSNTHRTAKSEAYKIEKIITDAFPDYEVYVRYNAPFWKVRVGDFKTLHEAQELRNEIENTFPSLKNYTYTVRDQVNY